MFSVRCDNLFIHLIYFVNYVVTRNIAMKTTLSVNVYPQFPQYTYTAFRERTFFFRCSHFEKDMLLRKNISSFCHKTNLLCKKYTISNGLINVLGVFFQKCQNACKPFILCTYSKNQKMYSVLFKIIEFLTIVSVQKLDYLHLTFFLVLT